MTLLVTLILVSSTLLLAWAPRQDDDPARRLPLPPPLPTLCFDGGVANLTVWAQEHMGPRLPGGDNAGRLRAYLNASLTRYGWNVSEQAFVSPELDNLTLTNLIARRGPDTPPAAKGAEATAPGPIYMLGAHYDTRPYNDMEPGNITTWRPIPGANDGASGVAALLELARALTNTNLTSEVWLVFFDGEDHGPAIDKMFLGSRFFSRELDQDIVNRTEAFVLLDMMGDADLAIPRERNSNVALLDELYGIAASLNETVFENRPGPSILDDHIYVADRGIPAVDLIDFTYPYWHTLNDTRDKVSAASLESVGRVVESWIRLKAADNRSTPSACSGVTELVANTDTVLSPGLHGLSNISVGPGITLTITNATVALYYELTLAKGSRLVLVDSILAAADTPDGRLPATRVTLATEASVEVIDSEWWGPEL